MASIKSSFGMSKVSGVVLSTPVIEFPSVSTVTHLSVSGDTPVSAATYNPVVSASTYVKTGKRWTIGISGAEPNSAVRWWVNTNPEQNGIIAIDGGGNASISVGTNLETTATATFKFSQNMIREVSAVVADVMPAAVVGITLTGLPTTAYENSAFAYNVIATYANGTTAQVARGVHNTSNIPGVLDANGNYVIQPNVVERFSFSYMGKTASASVNVVDRTSFLAKDPTITGLYLAGVPANAPEKTTFTYTVNARYSNGLTVKLCDSTYTTGRIDGKKNPVDGVYNPGLSHTETVSYTHGLFTATAPVVVRDVNGSGVVAASLVGIYLQGVPGIINEKGWFNYDVIGSFADGSIGKISTGFYQAPQIIGTIDVISGEYMPGESVIDHVTVSYDGYTTSMAIMVVDAYHDNAVYDDVVAVQILNVPAITTEETQIVYSVQATTSSGRSYIVANPTHTTGRIDGVIDSVTGEYIKGDSKVEQVSYVYAGITASTNLMVVDVSSAHAPSTSIVSVSLINVPTRCPERTSFTYQVVATYSNGKTATVGFGTHTTGMVTGQDITETVIHHFGSWSPTAKVIVYDVV